MLTQGDSSRFWIKLVGEGQIANPYTCAFSPTTPAKTDAPPNTLALPFIVAPPIEAF